MVLYGGIHARHINLLHLLEVSFRKDVAPVHKGQGRLRVNHAVGITSELLKILNTPPVVIRENAGEVTKSLLRVTSRRLLLEKLQTLPHHLQLEKATLAVITLRMVSLVILAMNFPKPLLVRGSVLVKRLEPRDKRRWRQFEKFRKHIRDNPELTPVARRCQETRNFQILATTVT